MKKNLDKLKIGNKFFNSRLMLGTGKYKTTNDAIKSIENSNVKL
jgi:thiazole synthase